jgi:sigma-B regulation protein RsbU (phosphoserine phosphatase)
LLYANRPAVVERLLVAADDPAREHLEGMGSMVCAPAYQRGEAQNMVVALRAGPAGFHVEELEPLLLNANLLALAANNMLLAQQLDEAYRRIDAEMQRVGETQRHLLPAELPEIEGLDLAASYVTSSRAGGDYYDVFALPGGRRGFFLADVSGHGIQAAVVMTMLHTLLHSFPGPPEPPTRVFTQLNQHLLKVAPEGTFATAWHGIYDPAVRELVCASAGHPPPRWRRGNRRVEDVPQPGGLPLGVIEEATWREQQIRLVPGDTLLLYTDGVTEGTNPAGLYFGKDGLDAVLRLGPTRAGPLVRHVERNFREFCAGRPDSDDRTLLAVVAVP